MRSRVRRLRLSEWLTSVLLIELGLHFLFYPASFGYGALASMGEVAPLEVWTLGLCAIGALRILALWINGHWPAGTPQIRLLGAAVGACTYSVLAVALYRATMGPAPSLGVVTFATIAVWDLLAVYFATMDMVHARRARG